MLIFHMPSWMVISLVWLDCRPCSAGHGPSDSQKSSPAQSHCWLFLLITYQQKLPCLQKILYSTQAFLCETSHTCTVQYTLHHFTTEFVSHCLLTYYVIFAFAIRFMAGDNRAGEEERRSPESFSPLLAGHQSPGCPPRRPFYFQERSPTVMMLLRPAVSLIYCWGSAKAKYLYINMNPTARYRFILLQEPYTTSKSIYPNAVAVLGSQTGLSISVYQQLYSRKESDYTVILFRYGNSEVVLFQECCHVFIFMSFKVHLMTWKTVYMLTVFTPLSWTENLIRWCYSAKMY